MEWIQSCWFTQWPSSIRSVNSVVVIFAASVLLSFKTQLVHTFSVFSFFPKTYFLCVGFCGSDFGRSPRPGLLLRHGGLSRGTGHRSHCPQTHKQKGHRPWPCGAVQHLRGQKNFPKKPGWFFFTFSQLLIVACCRPDDSTPWGWWWRSPASSQQQKGSPAG